MPTSRAIVKRVVTTYATALYEAAAAANTVDTVSMQLDAALRLVRAQAPLGDMLLDESIPASRREEAARQVFAGLEPALVEVIAVMAARAETDLLYSVSEAYAEVAEERRGIAAVDVTTAVELSDSLRDAIKRKLAADLGKEITLRETVDPSIIGGLVVSTHGHRIDASIASQLERARIVLSTAQSGGEA